MKEKIIETAGRLFVKKGYYQTTMDNVAEEAGIAKGSLYYHFNNKSQLFCETVINGIDYFSNLTSKIVSDNYYNEKVMAEKLIGLIVDIYVENEQIAEIVMQETDVGIDEDVANEIKIAKKKYISKIASIIDEGISGGVVRYCDSQIVASSMIMYIYTYCKLCREKGSYTNDKIKIDLNNLLLRGLLI